MHPKGDEFFQVHFKHSEIYFSVEYQTPFVWTVSSEKSMFEESYRAAKMMLGAESYWKDIKSEKENGGMDMCKALEDLRQEGIDIGVERGMKLGEERGVEQGVTRFIEAFQEMGMSYEDTARKLQEKFSLTEEDAEQKMKACWKAE